MSWAQVLFVAGLLGALFVSCGDSETAGGPHDAAQAGTAGALGSAGSAGSDASAGTGGGDAAQDRGTEAGDTSTDGPGLDQRPSNATCLAPARPATGASIQLVEPFPSLRFTQPTSLRQASDGSRWFVTERAGRIAMFRNVASAATAAAFLDLTPRVSSTRNETGLLGLAFDPDFESNGIAYVSYTGFGGIRNIESRLSRFRSVDGGAKLDPNSEEILLRLEQPYGNHKGGDIHFGPDGYLYMTLGDGGGAGDPENRAQDTSLLFGKVLRIDVRGNAKPYGIPPDNPFANGGGAPEIFAMGFRNPWRMSFDRETGQLWLGDVGQYEWEEIDRVERGGNYGWRFREAKHCFNPATNCPTAGLIEPIVENAHPVAVAIIGGYVYRGKQIPDLVGSYVFSDAGNGILSRIVYDPVDGTPSMQTLLETPWRMSAFSEDLDGELYFIDYTTGRIQRFAPVEPDAGTPPDTFPKTLSATGCVDSADATRPAPGLIPFDVNAPLWSDGADKQRWFAIPDGTTIQVQNDGDWELPVRSVVMKTFSAGGQRIETRLLVRHDDGEWAGYTYTWNDAGTDATLLEGAATKIVAGNPYYIPSRAECLGCHSTAAGRTLGLEHGQLDRDYSYPGGTRANQLTTLEHIGVLEAWAGARVAYPPPDGSASLESRARAYLHSNCSMCHRPGGSALGDMDLRFTTPVPATGTCNVTPENGDLGITDARLIVPGSPTRSMLPLRMRTRDARRMPSVASLRVDENGARVVEDWITALASCP